jgi:hypothetical protein
MLRAAESPNVTVIASIAGLANQRYVTFSPPFPTNHFASSFSSFLSFFIPPSILDRSHSSRALQNESPKPCSCLLSGFQPAQFPARINSLSKPLQTCPPLFTHFRVYSEQTPANPPTSILSISNEPHCGSCTDQRAVRPVLAWQQSQGYHFPVAVRASMGDHARTQCARALLDLVEAAAYAAPRAWTRRA